jgi:hypothetical protein
MIMIHSTHISPNVISVMDYEMNWTCSMHGNYNKCLFSIKN